MSSNKAFNIQFRGMLWCTLRSIYYGLSAAAASNSTVGSGRGMSREWVVGWSVYLPNK